MSNTEMERAMQLVRKCKAYREFKGVSIDRLLKAEKEFGQSFSSQTKHYFLKYGFIFYFGAEYYGLFEEDFDEGAIGHNAIKLMIHNRKKFDLPTHYLPIRFMDDYGDAYLDYSQLNEIGEPKVFLVQYQGRERGYAEIEKLADDLATFIASNAEDCLSRFSK